MMKKMLTLCLALCLLTGSAMAASLIQGGNQTSAALPNQVKILSVTSGSSNVTGVLTDDNMATSCYMPTGQGGTLMISLGGAQVSDIWLRNGAYASPDSYDRYDLATTMSVTIYSFANDKSSSVTYHYAMDASYNPNEVSDAWYYGYQRMALPQKHENVTFIALAVTAARSGYEQNNKTAFTDVIVTSGGTVSVPAQPPVDSGHVPGVLKMRLSTRTGPSTNYTEPGSFHSKGYELDVISQAYDDRNGIWWVQVEFEYKGEPMRAYTGVKRVDVDLQYVPVEECLGSTWITQEISNPWYGPGYEYRKHKNPVPYGITVDVYGYENGWLLVEYHDQARAQYRRVWVPREYTNW